MEKIIDLWNENKTKIIASIIFILFSGLVFFGIYFFNTMKAKADSIENDVVLENTNNNGNIAKSNDSNYKVDIKGYVKKPGVYEISNDSRIIDVIEKAGGLKDDADTSSINLSKKVFDEMVIIIYSKTEVKSIIETRNQETKKTEDCQNNQNKINNDACIDNNESKNVLSNNNTSSTNSSKININTASLDELESLNGVGESKARSIIEYRSENGSFKNIDEILNVKGIGNALFEKIKNNITI